MACCGAREKPDKILETQKWDYINLSDFRATSCIPPFSYFILSISFIISIASYVIDVFTAVQLMLFDRWGGRIEPAVPIQYSRWVFLCCILASWVFLVYRFWRARRAIQSGGIAQSYLDPLAVRLQSARIGSGRGWRRFLVFAEMTKGKKGADYIALFTYFSFEAWYRILLAEAPRNVINAMTIKSVAEANLLPNGKSHQNLSGIMQFLLNVKALADGDKLRAAVLFGMVFVVVVWIFATLSLILSCFFYVFFLWHHIPKGESLRGYCKRKVDSRLSKIVDTKVTKALDRADAKQMKEYVSSGKDGESIADIKQRPTLPILEPELPLQRQNTQSSTGSYAVDLERQPLRPFVRRMDTTSSVSSFQSHNSTSPLINDANPMGYAPPRSYSPAPSRPYNPGGLARMPTNGSDQLISPAGPDGRFTPAPQRSNTALSAGSRGPPRSGPGFGAYDYGRRSPSPNAYRPNQMQGYETRSQTPSAYPNRGHNASPFSPAQRSFTSPVYPAQQPPRNFHSPVNRGQSATPGHSDSLYDHY